MQKETSINTINSYRKYYTPSKIFLTSKLLSNILYKYLLHNRIHGEVSERLKEHDWKSCVRLYRTQGSNPCLSATYKKVIRWMTFFFYAQKRDCTKTDPFIYFTCICFATSWIISGFVRQHPPIILAPALRHTST